jgi:hypothetical protein
MSAPDTPHSSLDRPASVPWQSVHFAGEPPDRGPLEAAGIRVAAVDGAAVHSKQDLMEALSAALDLPDYFGGNWDALEEVLRDLGWLEAKGHVVLIENGEELWKRDPELTGMLVRSWIEAAGGWAEKGVPFHLVFAR